MIMTREWAMPNAATFQIQPIAVLLRKYLSDLKVVVDPFARNSKLATHTNDLNADTSARWHLPADEFCKVLAGESVMADAVLFDPPYSPRQISECYKGIGRSVTTEDTQSGMMYREVRDGLAAVLKPGGVAISFGWNSVGFGINRGFTIEEIMLVCHGGAHNDTIVLVERKMLVAQQNLGLT